MKSKVIFFDIDGTLLGRKIGVPDSTKKAIYKLKENGHIPIVCTGRTKPLISAVTEVMELPFAGIIGGAGTYVEYENKVISQALLSESILDKLLFLLKQMNACYTLEGPEHLYYHEEPSERQKRVWTTFLSEMDIVRSYKKGVSKVQKLFIESYDKSIFETIKPEFEKLMQVVQYEENDALEMICKGYTKAEGIRILISKLGIAKEDTFAFGDGPNDLEMLEYVQFGIAMGNSEQQVLSKAKYKTASIEDDGIYKGLKEFGLIE